MNPIIDQEATNSIKPRKPLAAALLALFPGLGQIYNGQPKKGLIFLLIDIVVPVLFGISGLLFTKNGLVTMVIVIVGFVIYRMADGFIVARRLNDYELKPVNKTYVYWLFALSVLGIRIFLNLSVSTGIQTFRISTPSMAPTLMPGDRIAAQLLEYRDTGIQYGDIVAFNAPQGGIWISRVVAMPLDSIEVNNGIISVNGYPNETKQIKEYMLDYFEAIEYDEQLPGNKKIKTLRFKNSSSQETRTMRSKFVPENEYFLMSDSRDDAYDSRFLGTIKKEDIIGKVLYTYWSGSSNKKRR